jgi:ABC-2 type transport system ATP-binding protein
MIGTPDEMKAALLERSILLDAADRPALVRELDALGLAPFVGDDGLVRVRYDGSTAQGLIHRIATPLTVLKVHDPSLEEAYVELLRSSGSADTEEVAA